MLQINLAYSVANKPGPVILVRYMGEIRYI